MSNILMFDIGNRKVPDYLGNRSKAQEIVNHLMNYYHQKGFTNVKVWIEPETMTSGKRQYYVRSNLVFRVPQF